jgi:N utilization substance protein B
LFEAEMRGLPVLEVLSERQSLGEQPVPAYTAELARGVAAHQSEIDDLISGNAVDWTLERMPAVDRNVLRLGVYELIWADDVPDGVAISEAVTLAQDLSTDASPAFVNGLLARIKDVKPSAAPED